MISHDASNSAAAQGAMWYDTTT